MLGFGGVEALLQCGGLRATVLINLRVAQLYGDLRLFGFELLDLAGKGLQFLALLVVELGARLR